MFAALTAIVCLAGLPAGADHCDGEVTVIGTDGVALFYIDDRGAPAQAPFVYMETNGEAGLQSGGSQALGLYEDTCTHEDPDTLLV